MYLWTNFEPFFQFEQKYKSTLFQIQNNAFAFLKLLFNVYQAFNRGRDESAQTICTAFSGAL